MNIYVSVPSKPNPAHRHELTTAAVKHAGGSIMFWAEFHFMLILLLLECASETHFCIHIIVMLPI